MKFEIVAEGLAFPEGPIVCEDGSVLVVEVSAGRISRVMPDGRTLPLAEPGGGPNGLAIGPDGLLYCCNNGGFDFSKTTQGHPLPSADYNGGSIQQINPSTGKVETILSAYDGRTFGGPNDIVFAADGSFWFTDFGKWTEDGMRHGGLYHAALNGEYLRQVSFGLCLNGVGLSPDGSTVYAAASFERWILAFAAGGDNGRQQGSVVANFSGRQFLDSMAIEASGVIAVGCVMERPGIGRVQPSTGEVELVTTPDAMPTNIAFGGADMRTAYITFSARGLLAKCRWPAEGQRLPFGL
jgi:gluconolactonase